MPSKTAIVVAGAAAHPEQLNAPELNDPLPPSYDQATGSYSPTKPGLPPTTLQKNPFPDAPVQLRQIQTTYMVQSIVGPHSTQAICPSCRMSINTLITHDSSVRTHLFALLCCILFWPCAWLPYCLKSCKDVHHYCPNCGAFLGAYKV